MPANFLLHNIYLSCFLFGSTRNKVNDVGSVGTASLLLDHFRLSTKDTVIMIAHESMISKVFFCIYFILVIIIVGPSARPAQKLKITPFRIECFFA